MQCSVRILTVAIVSQALIKLSTEMDNPKRLKNMSENVLQLITTTMPHMDPVSCLVTCTDVEGRGRGRGYGN